MRRSMLCLVPLLALLGARAPQPAQELRFTHLDVYVTPANGEALTAWQVELSDDSGRAQLVGVETSRLAIEQQLVQRKVSFPRLGARRSHAGAGRTARQRRAERQQLCQNGCKLFSFCTCRPTWFEVVLRSGHRKPFQIITYVSQAYGSIC